MRPKCPRMQDVVMPLLRDALPGVTVTSWVPDIDERTYPIINVRRLGGFRERAFPGLMDNPVLELTAYGDEGLPETELLYNRAFEALIDARDRQLLTDAGWISHVKETMGQTQYSSLFQDTWRVQGLIELGIRPRRRGSFSV